MGVFDELRKCINLLDLEPSINFRRLEKLPALPSTITNLSLWMFFDELKKWKCTCVPA